MPKIKSSGAPCEGRNQLLRIYLLLPIILVGVQQGKVMILNINRGAMKRAPFLQ